MMKLTRKIFNVFSYPAKLFVLITPARLGRLFYYVKLGQFQIIFDRIKRLIALGSTTRITLESYATSDAVQPFALRAADEPLVTIIVPAYNQWSVTRLCLFAIARNTQQIAYEVLLADDASDDETRDAGQLVKGLRHLRNTENLGFLRNCNKAATHSRGKYIVLLNNDTQVQSGWLAHLLDAIEENPSAGIVGSMLLYGDGSLQEAGGIIWQDGSGWNYGRHDFPERSAYNYKKPVDYVSGACCLIRKSLWQTIGGFDERFMPAYYEDTDLAFAARAHGYEVLYQPLSRVIHMEGVSHGSDVSVGIKSFQERNRRRFVEKWSRVLKESHARDPREIFFARDRSANKKHLLFIDHYVPRWDCDAGSRSTYQYLDLLVDMGYRITFLGDNFVDFQPYTRELQRRGIEVIYGAKERRKWKQWFRDNAKFFDYVYLSRPHIAQKYLPRVRRNGNAKVIYCGHDLHFLREQRHYEISGKLAHRREAERWRRIEERILRDVDIGYFFSSFEVSEVKKIIPGATVRSIPLYLFDNATRASTGSVDFSERAGLLFVGSFAHQPNVDAVLWLVETLLPDVRRFLPDVNLTVVGENPPAVLSSHASATVSFRGRVSENELARLYRSARLVVAPLRFGAGVKGKIVEAMYEGVPVVTTPVGAEGIEGSRAALAIGHDAEDFVDQLVRVYQDRSRWESLVEEMSRAVSEHFSKEAARRILELDMPL